jgi:hypothetical protein
MQAILLVQHLQTVSKRKLSSLNTHRWHTPLNSSMASTLSALAFAFAFFCEGPV